MLTNRQLVYIISIALLITLFGTALNLSRLGLAPGITGANVLSGNTSITINAVTEINLTGNISYGAGNVNAGLTRAQLDCSGAGYVYNGTWVSVSDCFIFENRGNTDINLSVKDHTNTTAVSFIGGTGPGYNYSVFELETNACNETVGPPFGYSRLAANNIINFTNNATVLCSNFSSVDSKDFLEVAINLSIPIDSVQGYRSVTFEFNGAATS